MKRMRWLLLLLLAGGPGCFGIPKTWEQQTPPRKVADAPPPPPPPAVQPEAITEHNYSQQFNALCNELDYDATHPPTGRQPPAGFTEGRP